MDIPVAVCLSDFHIGEDQGGVSGVGGKKYIELEKDVHVRREIQVFLDRLRELYGAGGDNRIEYLILLGDQWDLAVKPMSYSFNLSFGFFNKIDFENYFGHIIYLPGNHDHHLWRMFQTQKYIVGPLKEIQTKRDDAIASYPQVLEGILDLSSTQPVLTIDGKCTPGEGNGFISGLTDKSSLPVTTIYPNLYVIYRDNGKKKAMLLTHGHLFDPGWNVVTDMLKPSFGELGLKQMNLEILEMLNSPLTEFWNYSTAMMGRYDMIEIIYDNLLNNVFPVLIPDLLNDLITYLKKNTTGGIGTVADVLDWRWVKDYMDDRIKTAILHGVGTDARYDQEFIAKNSTRIRKYLHMSLPYIERQSIECFSRLVFGHTHVPLFGWKTKDLEDLELFNTGGWVHPDRTDSPMPLAIAADGNISPIDISSG